MIVLVDVDQFWCVTRITSLTDYHNSIDITDIENLTFIPCEIFNMINITYIYFYATTTRNKHILNRIPLRKRINLRNLHFSYMFKHISRNDSILLEFLKSIQSYKQP